MTQNSQSYMYFLMMLHCWWHSWSIAYCLKVPFSTSGLSCSGFYSHLLQSYDSQVPQIYRNTEIPSQLSANGVWTNLHNRTDTKTHLRAVAMLIYNVHLPHDMEFCASHLHGDQHRSVCVLTWSAWTCSIAHLKNGQTENNKWGLSNKKTLQSCFAN